MTDKDLVYYSNFMEGAEIPQNSGDEAVEAAVMSPDEIRSHLSGKELTAFEQALNDERMFTLYTGVSNLGPSGLGGIRSQDAEHLKKAQQRIAEFRTLAEQRTQKFSAKQVAREHQPSFLKRVAGRILNRPSQARTSIGTPAVQHTESPKRPLQPQSVQSS